jgi:ribosomal protein L40E
MGQNTTGFRRRRQPAGPPARQPASPGYILHPMTCHACGAQLSSTAKFCHKCGAPVTTGVQPGGWKAGFPWALAGAALGALVTVVAMRSTGARAGGAVSTEQSAPGSVLRAPDISQMSPDERATRLFNRVMILAEAGKADSVRFFLPMALGAYSQLPALDSDTRFHIGELHLAGGDPAGALAQADTIRRTEPTHLFIFVLRARAYHQQGNTQQERRAYSDFLRNEPAEMGKARPEYAQDAHLETLTRFKAQARAP